MAGRGRGRGGERLRILRRLIDDLTDFDDGQLDEAEPKKPKKRQNLKPKGLEPHKMTPTKKFERRIRGEIGHKRDLNRAGNRAAQRDSYNRSRTAEKPDGERNKIKKPRKVLGSVVRRPLRMRSGIR